MFDTVIYIVLRMVCAIAVSVLCLWTYDVACATDLSSERSDMFTRSWIWHRLRHRVMSCTCFTLVKYHVHRSCECKCQQFADCQFLLCKRSVRKWLVEIMSVNGWHYRSVADTLSLLAGRSLNVCLRSLWIGLWTPLEYLSNITMCFESLLKLGDC